MRWPDFKDAARLARSRRKDHLAVSTPPRRAYPSQSTNPELNLVQLSNWGLTAHELNTLPPSLVRGFMKPNDPLRSGFGSQLPDDFGKLLMRGEKNSELYGPLQEEYEKGRAKGTDVWVHKNRWACRAALLEWICFLADLLAFVFVVQG